MAYHYRPPTEKYPRALANVRVDDWITVPSMAEIAGVTERTVYRWISEDYVERAVVEGRIHVKVNTALRPPSLVKKQSVVLRKYSDAQLDAFVEEIVEGKREVKIDIGVEVRKGSPPEVFEQILKALDDYRELVTHILNKG